MTNDYYKVFQDRSSHTGRSFKSVVQKAAVLEFKRFLNSSPDAIDACINDKESNPIRIATILSKEKNDTIVRRFFLAGKEHNLKIGDLVYWEGTAWLLLKKYKDTINAYDKFEGIDCRHTIKWVDKFGVLQETPCYLVAQTDEKVKANFRTWNSMITPQPNKYLEIIAPRRLIELSQRFLVEDTAWSVVETDYISVKGVIYMSLVEDKRDRYEDDADNSIADIVDLNKYKLVLETNKINLGIDEEYQLSGKIYLNGNLYSTDIIVEILEGGKNINISDNLKVTGIAEGSAKLRISMEENNEINQEINIEISENAPETISYELVGDEKIKWGRTKAYQAVKMVNGVSEPVEATFSIVDNDKVVKNYEISNSSIIITANSDNIVGDFIISCIIDGQEFSKTVSVTSLWM